MLAVEEEELGSERFWLLLLSSSSQLDWHSIG